jgi:hypothetical protein
LGRTPLLIVEKLRMRSCEITVGFLEDEKCKREVEVKCWLQTEHDECLVADFILVANHSRHLDLGQTTRRPMTTAGGARLRTLKRDFSKWRRSAPFAPPAVGQARVRHPRQGHLGFVPPGGAPDRSLDSPPSDLLYPSLNESFLLGGLVPPVISLEHSRRLSRLTRASGVARETSSSHDWRRLNHRVRRSRAAALESVRNSFTGRSSN